MERHRTNKQLNQLQIDHHPERPAHRHQHGVGDIAAGREYLEQAFLTASDPDVKARVMGERIARLLALGNRPQAETLIAEYPAVFPDAAGQIERLLADQERAAGRREEQARQATIRSLEARQQSALARGDTDRAAQLGRKVSIFFVLLCPPLSSFVLLCPPSSFVLRPSSFVLHPSSFILHPSSFILHPSSFILHPSSFILHPSSFRLSRIRGDPPDPCRSVSHPLAQPIWPDIDHQGSSSYGFDSTCSTGLLLAQKYLRKIPSIAPASTRIELDSPRSPNFTIPAGRQLAERLPENGANRPENQP